MEMFAVVMCVVMVCLLQHILNWIIRETIKAGDSDNMLLFCVVALIVIVVVTILLVTQIITWGQPLIK
jgi:hypothetical protein